MTARTRRIGGIRLLRAALAGAVGIAALAIVFETPRAHADGSIDWRGDFETGDYSQWDAIQVGRTNLPNGRFSVNKTASQQMPLVRNPVRQGAYAAQVTVDPGDHGYSNDVDAALALHSGGETQGSDYYYGFSQYYPSDWQGSRGWGTTWELQAEDWYDFPSDGNITWDASNANALTLIFHTGLTPDRGAPNYVPAYNAVETLLSPLPKGVWLDFVVHIRYSAYWGPPIDSGPPGIFTVWYRQQGQSGWTKLYDDSGSGGAVINRPPHPTWMRNSNGIPSAMLSVGFYSAATPWRRTYYTDGWVRGTSFSAVADSLASVGSSGPPPPATTSVAATTSAAPPPPPPPTTTTSAPPPPPPPSGGNLAPDASFESDPSNDYYANGNASFSWTSDAAHSGSHSLKIVSTDSDLTRWMTHIPSIPAQPGSTYDLSVWVKVAGASPNAVQLAVDPWDSSEDYLGTTASTAQSIGGNQSWTQLRLQFTAPPGTASIRPEIRLTGPGTLWADDLAVTRH